MRTRSQRNQPPPLEIEIESAFGEEEEEGEEVYSVETMAKDGKGNSYMAEKEEFSKFMKPFFDDIIRQIMQGFELMASQIASKLAT